MKLSKVLIISKRTALEKVIKRQNPARSDPHLAYLLETTNEHAETLDHIRRTLEEKNIPADFIKRSGLEKFKKPLSFYDLIITVGGDGTLLNSSHYVKDTPVLGVLSSYKGSIGVLCGCGKNDFAKTIDDILKDRAKLIELQRLEIRIEDKPLPVSALNDALFAHQFPASTSRYTISYRGRSEYQKSSGVWIATAAGSTAAALSAGGKALPILSGNIVFIVRELFLKSGKSPLVHGIVKPDEKLVFQSNMMKGAIFIDGQPPHYPVGYGQVITIGLHPHPIRIFGYNKIRREKIIET